MTNQVVAMGLLTHRRAGPRHSSSKTDGETIAVVADRGDCKIEDIAAFPADELRAKLPFNLRPCAGIDERAKR